MKDKNNKLGDSIIHKKINIHKEKVKELGYEILFIGVIGSQNYGLAHKGSDVDTICVVKPQKYKANRNISTVVKCGNKDSFDDLCYVKDLFSFSEGVKKGSLRNIEVLKTKYFHGNLPGYLGKLKSNPIPKEWISNYQNGKLSAYKKKGDKADLFHYIRSQYYLDKEEVRDFMIEKESIRQSFIHMKENPDDIADNVDIEFQKEAVDLELTKKWIDFSEEDIFDFLETLDEKDFQKREFVVFEDTFAVISNQQYIESSRDEVFKMLNVYRGDKKIKNFGFQGVEALKVTPSDTANVDRCYTAFKFAIESFLKRMQYSGELFTEHMNFIAERELFCHKDIVSIPEGFYNDFITSEEFKQFLSLNGEYFNIDDVPGFYDKLDLKTGVWETRMRFMEDCIMVFNKFNNEYINIQNRQMKGDVAHKYVNFSSSKKKGTVYKNGRRTYIGVVSFGDLDSAKTIILTEGNFKAFQGQQLLGDNSEFVQLYPFLEGVTADAIIGLPGLEINNETVEAISGKNVILAFDGDAKTGHPNTIKMYDKLKNTLVANNITILGELGVVEKLDDDIIKYTNEKQEQKEKED